MIFPGQLTLLIRRSIFSMSFLIRHGRTNTLSGYVPFNPSAMLVNGSSLDEIGCSDPDVCYEVCNSRNGCNDIAYPLLVIRLMPNGEYRWIDLLVLDRFSTAIRGLTLACMIAALMSSLTSIFNSSSTIFTIDIWQRFRKDAHDWELMIVGRVFVLILVGISILWIPIIRAAQGSRLFDYIQAVQSFLAPPVAACYLLAVLWKRINEEVSHLSRDCSIHNYGREHSGV